MKILFCIATPRTRELGAPKILLELAEEMEQIGWQCQILCPLDFVSETHSSSQVFWDYHLLLRDYLQQHGHEFDVVDYDHGYLPFPRSDFPRKTLFVTRSVLLSYHFERIHIPKTVTWKTRLRHWLTRGKGEQQRQIVLDRSPIALQEADLVNVPNADDRATLLSHGIPSEKIAVIPYGMSRRSRPLFEAIPVAPPQAPIIAFVGTFDDRKGATDFPSIVQQILTQIPQAQFRLLGTAMSRDRVLSRFPKALRSHLTVIPKYAADELPTLLTGCAVGIFPSYLESFGFGVLEMLAAAIPVIAYNAPGPPVMLPPEYLVRPGDTTAMSDKIVQLLQQPEQLNQARQWARERSRDFCWQAIAQQTSQIYQEHWQRRQTEEVAP